MPPAKRQKLPPFREVKLICLGCIKNRTFKGSLRFIDSIPVVRSRGLTTHILMRKVTLCLEYYTENKLYVDGQKFNFTTSLQNTMILENYNESPSFTASQMGSTMTGKGPAKSVPSFKNQASSSTAREPNNAPIDRARVQPYCTSSFTAITSVSNTKTHPTTTTREEKRKKKRDPVAD